MGHSTFAGKTENNFSRNRHDYWYRTEVKMRMQLPLPSIFIVVGCIIVISSVNGRNVDNSEGPFEREMIRKLEAERGEGPPAPTEPTEEPSPIEPTEEPAPIELTEEP